MAIQPLRLTTRDTVSTHRPRVVRRSAADVAREYGPLIGFLGVTAAAAAYGSRFNPNTEHHATQRWYAARHKSRLNPPPAVFAPVWTTLYTLIAVAGWRVYRRPRSRARTRALALWSAQLAFNAAWTPLFFGKRQPKAALVDLAAMFAATAGFAATARNVDRTASRLMVPYLGWTAFAGYLNAVVARGEFTS
jgi:tryptophan-rich sensory protein